jgi:hypothetical protein
MDAEVYWHFRLVGYLRGVKVDQPYYHGEWIPVGDTEFEQEFRDVQNGLGREGVAAIPVTLRSTDGRVSAQARAMVRPPPERVPYFRFG